MRAAEQCRSLADQYAALALQAEMAGRYTEAAGYHRTHKLMVEAAEQCEATYRKQDEERKSRVAGMLPADPFQGFRNEE